MRRATISFDLRGHHGQVSIRYGVNDDPVKLGFPLLGLGFEPDAPRGFPVVEAHVAFGGEGYVGFLGWIQVVRYRVDGSEDPTVVAPDIAPQLYGGDVPYLSFGIRPILFDAPAMSGENIVWRAWSFLTQTPDLLITPVVEPICGFSWGYEVHDGRPSPTPLRELEADDWRDVREELRARLPRWTFGGDTWVAPPFD